MGDLVIRDAVVEVSTGPWSEPNTGPGGTGKRVRIRGYEEWTIGDDGVIAASLGHYDEADTIASSSTVWKSCGEARYALRGNAP